MIALLTELRAYKDEDAFRRDRPILWWNHRTNRKRNQRGPSD